MCRFNYSVIVLMAAGWLMLAGCAGDPPVENVKAQSAGSEAAGSEIAADATASADVGSPVPVEPYELAVASATDPLSPKRLVLVSRYGHDRVVEYLLQQGLDPNTPDNVGVTPLVAASEGGHLSIVNMLLTRNAQVNTAALNGQTALMAAAARGAVDVVNRLLDAGAQIDVANADGETALMHAIKFGQYAAARRLLERGANPNNQNTLQTASSVNGFTSLMYAADHGVGVTGADWTALTTLLLKHGAQPNIRNARGDSALSIAEKRFDRDIVRALEQAGAREERTYTSLDETDALVKAARLGDMDKAKALLDRGAKPDSPDEYGVTPLIAAAYEGQVGMVKQLIAKGAKLDVVPVGLRDWAFSASRAPIKDHDIIQSASRGDTALLVSIRRGQPAVADYLIDKGADPRLSNRKGEVPIFVAAAHGQVEIIRRLIKAGVDPNTEESEKLTVSMTNTLQVMGRNTPIITAAQAGHTDVVAALLEAAAAVNHRGFLNKTALFWAVDRGYVPTAELLLTKGANPNINDSEGLTPLIISARTGNSRLTRLLLDHRAEPNRAEVADVPGQGGASFNTTGMTALIYASRAGHNEIVNLLIKAGANVNAMSQAGETAFKEAMNNGHKDIAQQLKVAGGQ